MQLHTAKCGVVTFFHLFKQKPSADYIFASKRYETFPITETST